jgi:hypothetical protein
MPTQKQRYRGDLCMTFYLRCLIPWVLWAFV